MSWYNPKTWFKFAPVPKRTIDVGESTMVVFTIGMQYTMSFTGEFFGVLEFFHGKPYDNITYGYEKMDQFLRNCAEHNLLSVGKDESGELLLLPYHKVEKIIVTHAKHEIEV